MRPRGSMRILRNQVCLLLLLVLLGVPGLAQTSGPASAASEAPVTTFRSTTRLVQLSVVVQDKRGQPVSGLTKDDFTILDKGEQQKIALFAQEGGAASQPAKQLPPGIYTNLLPMKGEVPGNVTVVLLDALNTRLQDQSYARSQAIKFLKGLQRQDHVAIYSLTTKLEILHDFTQNIDQLIAAVARYEGRGSGQLSASEGLPPDLNPGPPAVSQSPGTPSLAASSTMSVGAMLQMMQDLFDNAQARQQEMAAINRAEATLSAIEAIARHLAPVPGRKNLVWISGSFPLAIGQEGPSKQDPNRESYTFEQQLDRVARVLNQANMAIYPVDARGLMESINYNAAEPQRVDPHRGQGFGAERDTRDFISMDLLADRTGGRSFHNNNDLAGVVRSALADSVITYQLAFYPSHGKWDGKYHDLKVHVKRPDIQLHYRKGYYALAEPTDNKAEQKAEIDGAVASPLDATNLSILVQMLAPAKDTPDQFGVNLMLNPREIEFVDTSNGKSCVLDFVFVQLDATGKQLNGEQRHAEFNPDEKKYESLLQTGLLVTNHVKLLHGVAVLKVVVRDARSGAVGSVTVPLKSS